MVGFAESFAVWTVSTVIPALIGLFIIVWVGRLTKPLYTAAFALGIFLWFFVDTIEGSASLYVNDGFTGGAEQAGIVLLFTLGILFFSWADRNREVFNAESAVGKYGIAIPLMVAVAVGIHGFGEGTAFAANVASTSGTILEDFGGISAGIAYVFHKGLEPMMIGACYSFYSGGRAKNYRDRIKDISLLSFVFVVPSLIGAATGYFFEYKTTFFFALGTGSSIYAALRLAGPLFGARDITSPKVSLRIVGALVLGFLAIYIAALFHS